MRKIWLNLFFVIPFLLCCQITFEPLFDIPVENHDEYSTIQLFDFDEDGIEDIVTINFDISISSVKIHNLEGLLLYQNQFEMDSGFESGAAMLYRDAISCKFAVVTSYYLDFYVFDMMTAELIINERVGDEPFAPHIMGEALAIKIEINGEQTLFYLSLLDISEYSNHNGWWQDEIPYVFLYSFDNEFEFINYYENIDTMYLTNNIAKGISSHSSGEFEGNRSTTHISRCYTLEDGDLFPDANFLFDLWDKMIYFVSSDEEINDELGFVYSYQDNELQKFFCITYENELLWSTEYPLDSILFSANLEIDENKYVAVFAANKVLLMEHQTGEIVHSEQIELPLFQIKKSQANILYGFAYDIVDSQELYHVYQLEFNEFFVEGSTDVLQSDETFLRNYPNPFNPSTTIQFSNDYFEHNEQIDLEIFNLKGQRVRQFKIKNQKGEKNEIIWDGKDEFQNPASSGIYLYRIKSGSGILETKKMILLK